MSLTSFYKYLVISSLATAVIRCIEFDTLDVAIVLYITAMPSFLWLFVVVDFGSVLFHYTMGSNSVCSSFFFLLKVHMLLYFIGCFQAFFDHQLFLFILQPFMNPRYAGGPRPVRIPGNQVKVLDMKIRGISQLIYSF